MQLYVGPCNVVCAEIAVAMAVAIENPAYCEVRGVIRFLQADEIIGHLVEEISSRVELFGCTTLHVCILLGRQDLLREQFHCDIFEHPPYSPNLAPSYLVLFPRMKEHLTDKHFANVENLKDAG